MTALRGDRPGNLLACLVLLALASCGGGGSDSDEAPGATTPRLVLSTTSVNVSALVTSGERPISRITTTVEDGSADLYIRVRYSDKGIANVYATRDNGPLEVLTTFRTPLDLRPATYDDVLVFELCPDATCSSVVGTPVRVPMLYEVVAPVVAPAVTLSASALTLRALITDGEAPGVPALDLAFTGPQMQPFVRITWAGPALANASFLPANPNGVTGGRLNAGVQSPSTLGPGFFEGTIKVVACLDQNCVNPLAGSPLTLPVQLTVSDHVDGPNGYRVRIVEIPAADMVWDATRQLLYVASPERIGTNHRISVVDPVTASVVSSKAMPDRPIVLAGSRDGQYLYVASAPAALQRLRMSDLSIDANIPLGTSSRATDYYARQIAVSPDNPLTIAVSRSTNLDTPANGGLVIYDNTTARSSVLAEQPEFSNTGPFMDLVTWGRDSSVLFAATVSTPALQLHALRAESTGARIDRSVNASGMGRLHFDSDRLYTSQGEMLDPATLDSLGRFITPTNRRFASVTTLDVAGGRAYVAWGQLGQNSNGLPDRFLSVFDLASRAEIASLPLNMYWSPGKVLRVGNNRLAMLVSRSFDTCVVLIDGPFVGP